MTPFQYPPGTKPKEKPRDIQQKAKTLTDDIGELLDLYYKLAVITVTEKASNAASVSITVIVILFFMMFTMLFGGLALGWYLGEVLESMLAGYGIIAGIFIVFIALTLLLRKSFLFPYIRNTIIKKIYEQG
jgi:hypothetical protein